MSGQRDVVMGVGTSRGLAGRRKRDSRTVESAYAGARSDAAASRGEVPAILLSPIGEKEGIHND